MAISSPHTLMLPLRTDPLQKTKINTNFKNEYYLEEVDYEITMDKLFEAD